MKTVTAEQMRELDRRTIEGGVPGGVLMDRAGHGLARLIANHTGPRTHGRPTRVLLTAGHGNNGGDAFVAARYLAEWRYHCDVRLAATCDRVRGDAADALNRFQQAGGIIRECPHPNDWHDNPPPETTPHIVVDGLLGTGTQGVARPPLDAAIRFVNACGAYTPVVAIDIPSGLHADNGTPQGDTVIADITVTMAMPKQGLLAASAIAHVGRIEVVDIGVPRALTDAIESPTELITDHDVRQHFPRRRRDAHKGTYGHVLLIGGSAAYSGAIGLATRAALRSGAGRVSVITPASQAAAIAAMAPEAMVHAAPQTAAGSLQATVWQDGSSRMQDFTAILAGPGMTTHPDSRALVDRLCRHAHAPLVLDADALNARALARDGDTPFTCPAPVVLTPHPGELARLLHCSTADIQRDRTGAAQRAALTFNSVTVLKGAGTVVQTPGSPPAINTTGNPGMATGGTGDVLAGLLVGLLGQGMSPANAAWAAVYLHGLAGDLAARSHTEVALTAGDLIAALPRAMQRVASR